MIFVKDISLQINKQRVIFSNKMKVFQTPLPFHATKITKPFSIRISANHDKEKRCQPIVKYLYSLMFLQCRISVILVKACLSTIPHKSFTVLYWKYTNIMVFYQYIPESQIFLDPGLAKFKVQKYRSRLNNIQKSNDKGCGLRIPVLR